MIRINLLPAKFRKTQGAQRIYTYAIIGLSMLGLVLIVLLLNLVLQTHRVETRLAQVDAASAKMADRIEYLRGLTAREEQSEQMRKVIRRLQPDQALWIVLLDDLARLVREDLWLTRLAPEKSAKQPPLRLTVDGEAYNKIAVADFLGALESSDRFTDVQLMALTDTKTASATFVQFSLKMGYRTEPAATGSRP